MPEVYGIYGNNKCKREAIPGKIYQVTVKSFPSEGIAADSVTKLKFDLSPYLDNGMTVDDNVVVLEFFQNVYDSANSSVRYSSGHLVRSNLTYPSYSKGIDGVTINVYNKANSSKYGVSATLTFLVTNIHSA